VKVQLIDGIDHRVGSALDAAERWIVDARSKVAWCSESEGSADHDSIDVRLSAINDVSDSLPDGELIRDSALRHVNSALQAAVDSSDSRWSNQCQQLNDSWAEFTRELERNR